MAELPANANISDFQTYVREMKLDRGFSTDDKIYECFLLGEEVGELFKAVRKHSGWKVDAASKPYDVADELADCFIYLLSIANQHDIDMEKAFRDKEEKNKTREWKKVAS